MTVRVAKKHKARLLKARKPTVRLRVKIVPSGGKAVVTTISLRLT